MPLNPDFLNGLIDFVRIVRRLLFVAFPTEFVLLNNRADRAAAAALSFILFCILENASIAALAPCFSNLARARSFLIELLCVLRVRGVTFDRNL
jgi:hypothetical protein